MNVCLVLFFDFSLAPCAESEWCLNEILKNQTVTILENFDGILSNFFVFCLFEIFVLHKNQTVTNPIKI
jgi:hypothetical protein